MSELLHALGINGKALIIQAVNFGILLTVLTLFVYRPLARIMEERRKKIELGIRGGEKAAERLAEIETQRQEALKAADRQALSLIRSGEEAGKQRFAEIVHGAEEKADYLLKEAAATAKRREAEEMQKVAQEARELVRSALIKTVELDPKAVDEKLITQAIHEVRA